jgi:molybdopterin-guanine dinucleotide biosynthesis protein A
MSDVSAFVLAGGSSSRMGRDKAFLEWRGQTLLERVLALARTVSGRASIAGQREKFAAFAPVVEDVFPGQGPLAGIHAALSSSPSDLNLILAVDTPLVTPEFLAYLVAESNKHQVVSTEEPSAAGGGAPTQYSVPSTQCLPIVTAPRMNGKIQPLCAVYRKEFAPIAEVALRAGRNKIEPLFDGVARRVIEEEELRRLDFDARMFDNLNTPEEWEKIGRW